MTTTETLRTTIEEPPKVAGIVAQFASAEALLAAAAGVRKSGIHRFDAHSPMPIHGMERAAGIRMTILPWLVLAAGMVGGAVGLWLPWYVHVVAYPLIISGKPMHSLPAHVPVAFELIVLFSCVTAFVSALLLGGLPRFWHGVFTRPEFQRLTTDGFFLSIDARRFPIDESQVRRLLESLGALRVETYYEPVEGQAIPVGVYWTTAIVLALAPIPLLTIAWIRATPSSKPRIQILQDMDAQPKYRAQQPTPLFVDGRVERPQVPGSIARGQLREDAHFYAGRDGDDWASTFPASVPLNMTTMRRGRERYNIYCAPCHGLSGDGDGLTSARALERGEAAWVPPLQLYVPTVRFQPVGQLFNAITHGVRKMPAYGAQIPPEDRWAIVLYLQALQRSQAASAADLPADVREKLATP